MPIQIWKDDGLFRAEVTPPDGERAWSSPTPMERSALIAQLFDLGCRQTDVSEALFEADNPSS